MILRNMSQRQLHQELSLRPGYQSIRGHTQVERPKNASAGDIRHRLTGRAPFRQGHEILNLPIRQWLVRERVQPGARLGQIVRQQEFGVDALQAEACFGCGLVQQCRDINHGISITDWFTTLL